MKHYLRKIDNLGLFLEDTFWEDGAYPATAGVPYQPAVPAVVAAIGVEAKPAVPEVPAVPAVPAFSGNPIPIDLIATVCPGGFYKPKWSGTTWVEGALPAIVTAALDANISAAAKAKLSEIDLKSIRAIREYIASKADAPTFLKALEAESVVERGKIK